MDESINSLSNFIDDVCQDSHLRVETDLGDGFVRLRSDEAERRQAAHDIRSTEDIVIELLRNSRDANAHRIFLATTTETTHRKMVVIDDGVGIPTSMQELIFEPRVTSKLDSVHMDKWGIHGRGMALYSVSMNTLVSEVALSDKGLGSSIRIESDTSVLAEKADQSTFPTIATKDGKAVIRGPHNINRTAVEFALEHRNTLEVYVGSSSEIASTLYETGCLCVPATQRLFTSDLTAIPLVLRLAYSQDEIAFSEICSTLGLQVSPRNARRILDGQIAPLMSLSDRVKYSLTHRGQNGEEAVVSSSEGNANAKSSSSSKASTPRKSTAPSKILDKAGIERFKQDVGKAFVDVADSYYLNADVDINVKVINGKIQITIPLVESD